MFKNKKGEIGLGHVIVAIVGIYILVQAGVFSGLSFEGFQPEEDMEEPTPVYETATLYYDFYDQAADTETSVSPTVTVVDTSNDKKLINDAVSANTTRVDVGDQVRIYGTGASYYVDPETVDIDSKTVDAELDAYAVGTVNVADYFNITVYDEQTDELTADDHANNSALNSITLGAGETKKLFYKISQKEDNTVYDLGSVVTFTNGDIESLELASSYDGHSWGTGDLGRYLSREELTIHDDTNTTYGVSFDDAYVPSGGKLRMKEWNTVWLQATVKDDGDDSSANTGDYFGITLLDNGHAVGGDGNVYEDYFVHDDDEEPYGVGVNETMLWKGIEDGELTSTNGYNGSIIHVTEAL